MIFSPFYAAKAVFLKRGCVEWKLGCVCMSSGESWFSAKSTRDFGCFLYCSTDSVSPDPRPTWGRVLSYVRIFGAASELCFFDESIIFFETEDGIVLWLLIHLYYYYLTKDGHIFGILKDLELLTVMFHDIEPTQTNKQKKTLLAQIPLSVLNILQPGGISRSMVNRLKAFYYPPLVCL